MRVAQGDLPGALEAYEESLRIARALADRDKGNAGWARDVSVSLNKVGDVRVAQGDLPGALEAYEESLRIAPRPRRPRHGQRRLGPRRLGQPGTRSATCASPRATCRRALEAYEESLRIRPRPRRPRHGQRRLGPRRLGLLLEACRGRSRQRRRALGRGGGPDGGHGGARDPAPGRRAAPRDRPRQAGRRARAGGLAQPPVNEKPYGFHTDSIRAPTYPTRPSIAR